MMDAFATAAAGFMGQVSGAAEQEVEFWHQAIPLREMVSWRLPNGGIEIRTRLGERLSSVHVERDGYTFTMRVERHDGAKS